MLSWRVCLVINISSLVCFNCVSFDDSVSDYDSICLLQISRLIYTNSGDATFVLASNAINLLWKWLRNEHNSGGKVNGHQNCGFPPFCTEVILRIVSIFV